MYKTCDLKWLLPKQAIDFCYECLEFGEKYDLIATEYLSIYSPNIDIIETYILFFQSHQ